MFAGPGFVSTPKVHAFNECSTQLRNKTALAYKNKKNVDRHAEALPPPPVASRHAPAVDPERHATRLPPHPVRHVTVYLDAP